MTARDPARDVIIYEMCKYLHAARRVTKTVYLLRVGDGQMFKFNMLVTYYGVSNQSVKCRLLIYVAQ